MARRSKRRSPVPWTALALLLAMPSLAILAPPLSRMAPLALVLPAIALAGALLGYLHARAPGVLGASMLVDLRDRLSSHGEVPRLEPGWHVDTVLRSAWGESFSGDFLVATRVPRELADSPADSLELVLVDVSGKGQSAGTRSLLLSGAFGGLLGALAPADFLPAANRYLIRQRWEEGFATAVHLSLDLGSGAYRLAGAGHPPAAQFLAGSGRWLIHDREQGPILGVLADPEFPAVHGQLGRGDALLLYTDGLVEGPQLDVGRGIDRLLGEAERVVARRFRGGAARIVDGTRSGEGDDRALVLIWRD